jgi:hypothetical protein
MFFYMCITVSAPTLRKSDVRSEKLYATVNIKNVSRWGWGGGDFPHPFKPGLRPTQPPVQWVLVKRPGYGVDHPPPSSADVKERVEVYLY